MSHLAYQRGNAQNMFLEQNFTHIHASAYNNKMYNGFDDDEGSG